MSEKYGLAVRAFAAKRLDVSHRREGCRDETSKSYKLLTVGQTYKKYWNAN